MSVSVPPRLTDTAAAAMDAPATRMSAPALRVAYFGHDIADAAIRRRVAALVADGIEVTGFMMRRRDDVSPNWENIELGQTEDASFGHEGTGLISSLSRVRDRCAAVFSGAARAARDDRLVQADVILARNLDMLACALKARRRVGLSTPVIYECLDVHRLLCRGDVVGSAMRALERRLLRACDGLIVSSPGFIENHFEPRYGGFDPVYMVENRLAAGTAFGPRPTAGPGEGAGPVSIGWIGNLRCQRSLDLLLGLADRLGEQVQIHLHGAPARTEIACFEPRINARENVTYHGRYKAPEDLADIYAGLDLVWAGDFMEAGYNSVWLLPNRLYEGGYYGVPPIAPAGTQTARWIADRRAGFVVDEPLEASLEQLVAQLAEDRRPARAARARLLSRPVSDFVAPEGEMGAIVADVIARGRKAA